MIQYQQKQDKNWKMSQACGKWHADPVVRRIVDKEGLAEHMGDHERPTSWAPSWGSTTTSSSERLSSVSFF